MTHLRKRSWHVSSKLFSVRAICVLTVLVGILLARPAHGQGYVVSWNAATVGEYTTSGATVNDTFITGLFDTMSLPVDGTFEEYTASEPTVDAALVSGLNGGPTFMAVVPEPSAAILAVPGLALLMFRRMIRRLCG